jgi:hypothetical protein
LKEIISQSSHQLFNNPAISYKVQDFDGPQQGGPDNENGLHQSFQIKVGGRRDMLFGTKATHR